MRNLKRALSLALASVMLLGMMVVGTGASYADVDSADNVEAIEVMQAVGVMVGDTNGNFNPDQKVTRGEMAVVMANLLNLNVKDFIGAKTPFTDVPEWAVPYVAACYADGITAGISATEYGFNYEVTTAQAALMMMKALGYFQFAPDFGQDWQVSTVKQGSKINLFDGVDAGASTALTRNEVAQLALNTLEASMVDYSGSQGTNITMPDGTSIVTGYTIQYNPITITGEGAANYAGASATDGSVGTQQLCEKLYGTDLKKNNGATTDDFGRPGYTWTYEGKAATFAIETPVKTYTGAVKAADVAKDLSGYKIYETTTANAFVNVNDVTAYTSKTLTAPDGSTNLLTSGTSVTPLTTAGGSGETIANAIAGRTANGKVVEIYANDNNQITKIVEVVYTVAEVTGVTTTKDKTTYTFSNSVSNGIDYVDDSTNDTIDIAGTIAKGDYVTTVKPAGSSVLYVYPTTKVVGALSSISTKDNTVTVNGTAYEVGAATNAVAIGSYAISTDDANFFLDQYGYVVNTSNIVSNNYAYVVGSYGTVAGSVDGGTPSAQVKVVFADGTVGTYDLKLTKQANGDYKAAGIDVYKASDNGSTGSNSSDVDGYVSALEGEIFAYALEGKTIDLTALTAADSSSVLATAGKYTTELSDVLSNEGSIANNATSTKVAHNSTYATALMDSKTVYVFYDSVEGTAVARTGNTNIKGYTVANTATNAMVVESDGTAFTTKYVFVTGVAYSAASHEYIYVDASEYTMTKEDGNTYYAYDAIKADGSTVVVKAKTTALTDDGLYILNDDLSVAATDAVYTYVTSSWGVRNSYARGAIFAQGTATVTGGSLVSVDSGSTYYNMSADVQTVYIDDTKGTVDGNSVILVRGWDNGAATSEVVAIFVIG